MNSSILLIPSIRRKGGLGHLVRMMRLALSWKGTACLFLEPGDPLRWTEEEVRSFFPEFPWDRHLERNPGVHRWDWVVFDRRSTSRAEYLRLQFGSHTLGLDEGGEARPLFSFLVDTFPRLKRKDEPNRVEPRFVPLLEPHALESSPQKRPFLLAFGGEDPYGLSELASEALVKEGIEPEDIDVLLGPARQKPFSKPCGEILRGGWDAGRHFSRYRWVVTSFGLTPYEAILSGATPLLVNPTGYHERLAQGAHFYSLGVRRVSPRRLRFALEHPDVVLPRWASGLNTPIPNVAPSSGLTASFVEYLSTLQPDIPPRCPLCGKDHQRATFRFHDRSFFECLSCKTEFRIYFGGQKKAYTARYFLEEYRQQYGKTYVEDFQKIKDEGKKRLQVLKECLSTVGTISRGLPVKNYGPFDRGSKGYGSRGAYDAGGQELLRKKTILDAGCALGPFLDAAREEGMVPYGIDLSEDAVRYVGEKLGIPARVADIEDFDSIEAFGVESFDVVSLWYVIEHLPRVGRVLERVRAMLRKGGWLMFSTPNGRGVSSLRSPRSFREQSPIDHVTIWNVSQARRILRRYGFVVRAVRIPSHHPERFPPLARALIGSKGCALLERLLYLGDTFEVYAQKIDHDSRGRASADSCH